eukprot:7823571-Pyramimonas_sp.AAC.1
MPHPVMRADLFRYLIVLRYGGIYTDVDTECMVSLAPFYPPSRPHVPSVSAEHASQPPTTKKKL